MIARIAILALCLLTALSPAAEKMDDFEYGKRPPSSVFDPLGFLAPGMRKEISGPLGKVLGNDGIDIVVVILDDLGGAPPEHVARRFAEAWCSADIHAVVLHVPGRADSPWIVPGGKLVDYIKPELRDGKINELKRDALRQPTEQDRIRTASTEVADALRYWKSSALNRSDVLKAARSEYMAEQETKAKRLRFVMLAGIAASILLAFGALMLMRLLRRPGPRRFPTLTPPRRLGAPFAGGNHVIVDLRSPPP